MGSRSSRRFAHPCRASAFTLVELLVAISIIGVLLGIAIPCLRSARAVSNQSLCTVRLRSAVQLHLSAAANGRDLWPNDYTPATTMVDWRFANVSFGGSSTTLIQSSVWIGPLLTRGVYDPAQAPGDFTCPDLQRVAPSTPAIEGPIHSYASSAAMFTAPELWNPDVPRPVDPEAYRRSIAMHEVLFPSRKVVMSEQFAAHSSGEFIGKAGLSAGAMGNAAFADGHAESVAPAAASPALPAPWYSFGPGLTAPIAMPFSAAAGGCRGRDY